ncbi:MAG: class I tRNA ligase family protein, partial [bacterium]|nr:class I tRNA ligase family protein [bacterium]
YRVGHCYRCDTVIEPYISQQWFVKMKQLVEPAIKVVLDGKLKFYPERWTKIYLHWLNNIQDWCISRQIWWGHRIPVWYCKNKNCVPIASIEKPELCSNCGGSEFIQDEDVLDTWFSSWLWPFAVFGWPEKTKDLEFFYPTSTLVTAQEILFFWVARMVMAGFEFTGKKPFEAVYIHGTVRDETGRKMSKSLGNAIDPIEIIEEVGADALRFSLISLTAFGQDVFLPSKFHYKGRNFLNKIWNSCRYIEMLLEKNKCEKVDMIDIEKISNEFTLPERWILTLLNRKIDHINRCLHNFKFNEATDLLYEFFWHEFCDWYLELSKKYCEKDPYLIKCVIPVLFHVFEKILKLLHPFIPFITEEIYNRFKKYTAKSDIFIAVSPWPESIKSINFEDSLILMDKIKKIVVEIRDIKTCFRIPFTSKVEGKYHGISLLDYNEYREDIEFLAKVQFKKVDKNIKLNPNDEIVRNWDSGWFSIRIKGIVNVKEEIERLYNDREKILKIYDETGKKLASQSFLSKAPVEIVERTKKLYGELEEELRKIDKNIKFLKGENQ